MQDFNNFDWVAWRKSCDESVKAAEEGGVTLREFSSQIFDLLQEELSLTFATVQEAVRETDELHSGLCEAIKIAERLLAYGRFGALETENIKYPAEHQLTKLKLIAGMLTDNDNDDKKVS
jgi:hypothetical protein